MNRPMIRLVNKTLDKHSEGSGPGLIWCTVLTFFYVVTEQNHENSTITLPAEIRTYAIYKRYLLHDLIP